MDIFNMILDSLRDSDYGSFDLDPIETDGTAAYIIPSIRYKIDTEGTSDDAATIILTNTIHSKGDNKTIKKLIEIRITINRDTLKHTTRGVYVLTDGFIFDLHDTLRYPVGWTDPMKGLVNQILCTLKLRVYYSKNEKVIYKRKDFIL